MSHPDDTAAPTFDCYRGGTRHKVLAGDGICVLCGARGVIDARKLPPPPPPPQSPTPIEL